MMLLRSCFNPQLQAHINIHQALTYEKNLYNLEFEICRYFARLRLNDMYQQKIEIIFYAQSSQSLNNPLKGLP